MKGATVRLTGMQKTTTGWEFAIYRAESAHGKPYGHYANETRVRPWISNSKGYMGAKRNGFKGGFPVVNLRDVGGAMVYGLDFISERSGRPGRPSRMFCNMKEG